MGSGEGAVLFWRDLESKGLVAEASGERIGKPQTRCDVQQNHGESQN